MFMTASILVLGPFYKGPDYCCNGNRVTRAPLRHAK